VGVQVTSRGFCRSLATIAILAVSGCGSSPIVPTRVDAAMKTTFSNLVHRQVSLMGLTPMSADDFAVRVNCRKLLGDRNVGSGDWICVVLWRGPDRQTAQDTYDLFVTTDGCYTATVEGEALGGPTLRMRDGREVKNLLHTFEGCFDTT
jgi:hypothetical protein